MFLEFPTGSNTPALTGYDFVSDPTLVSNDALSIMVQAIRMIEAESVKSNDERRRKGMNWSRSSYGINAVRKQLAAIPI